MILAIVDLVKSTKIVMVSKRKVSILIPYKIDGNKIFVYLQKRSKDAQRIPGYFGFFGGGAEGNENPEQALEREIKEELDFVPKNFSYFKKYEFEQSVKDIFMLAVKNDFEDTITILEGEYGQWFDKEDVLAEPKLIEEDKIVLQEFYESLNTKI
jgi:mutator protein MutT